MKKQFIAVGLLLFSPALTYACITCNQKVKAAIFDSTFYPNLITLLSAFIVLAILVVLLAVMSGKQYQSRRTGTTNTVSLTPVPLLTAATVLGIGAGGFIDGIVLHQILQWHEMLSNKIPPVTLVAKSVNMFWDGIFHAFCLLVMLTGIILLWRLLSRKDIDRSGRLLAGGLLVGWALFNFVEGFIDHHILKLHNVREVTDNPAAWNWGFLGFSVLLLASGVGLIRTRSSNKAV